MANAFRMLPTNPASNCGTEFYQRVVLTLDFHVLTALAAIVLLLAVWMAVSAAESNAVTVLLLAVWMVVSAAESNAVTVLQMAVSAAESKVVAATQVHARAKAFDAHHEAAAAVVEGVASITAKWRRASLRGTLLLAVVLSAASCILAAVAFEEGCMYWVGCDAGYGMGSTLSVFLMVSMVLMHGFSVWIAVSQN